VPLIMKMVLDCLHTEIFEQNTHSLGGKVKAAVFYVGVLVLTIMMIVKGIKSKSIIQEKNPYIMH